MFGFQNIADMAEFIAALRTGVALIDKCIRNVTLRRLIGIDHLSGLTRCQCTKGQAERRLAFVHE